MFAEDIQKDSNHEIAALRAEILAMLAQNEMLSRTEIFERSEMANTPQQVSALLGIMAREGLISKVGSDWQLVRAEPAHGILSPLLDTALHSLRARLGYCIEDGQEKLLVLDELASLLAEPIAGLLRGIAGDLRAIMPPEALRGAVANDDSDQLCGASDAE